MQLTGASIFATLRFARPGAACLPLPMANGPPAPHGAVALGPWLHSDPPRTLPGGGESLPLKRFCEGESGNSCSAELIQLKVLSKVNFLPAFSSEGLVINRPHDAGGWFRSGASRLHPEPLPSLAAPFSRIRKSWSVECFLGFFLIISLLIDNSLCSSPPNAKAAGLLPGWGA